MSTEHADGPQQGPGADQNKHTNSAIIPRQPRLRPASERAAESVIDTAASVASLCLYVAGFRLAYELAVGVVGRG